MIILDETNGGFNGVTKGFYTTALNGNQVVRKYYKALQGGYLVNDDKGNGSIGGEKNIYEIYGLDGGVGYRFMFFESFFVAPRNGSDAWLLPDIIGFLNSFDTSIYTFEPNMPIKIQGNIGIANVANINMYMSNLALLPKDGLEEIFKMPSVFYCDNKENLSKSQIFSKFKISNHLTQASNVFKNKIDTAFVYIKPFVVIIKSKNNKLKVYLLLKDLNGGELIEHSVTCDIGSNISVFSAGLSHDTGVLYNAFDLYGGIGVVNFNETWAMDAKLVSFDNNGTDYKIFTITAPTDTVYYNDVWEQIEHNEYNLKFEYPFIYANWSGSVHYLTGLKRNFNQRFLDSSTADFQLKQNIGYAAFSPLRWFCSNYDECMEI